MYVCYAVGWLAIFASKGGDGKVVVWLISSADPFYPGVGGYLHTCTIHCLLTTTTIREAGEADMHKGWSGSGQVVKSFRFALRTFA